MHEDYLLSFSLYMAFLEFQHYGDIFLHNKKRIPKIRTESGIRFFTSSATIYSAWFFR